MYRHAKNYQAYVLIRTAQPTRRNVRAPTSMYLHKPRVQDSRCACSCHCSRCRCTGGESGSTRTTRNQAAVLGQDESPTHISHILNILWMYQILHILCRLSIYCGFKATALQFVRLSLGFRRLCFETMGPGRPAAWQARRWCSPCAPPCRWGRLDFYTEAGQGPPACLLRIVWTH